MTSMRTMEMRSGLGAGLLALAALLVVNTVLGPILIGVVDYPITESMTNQLLGLAIVTLVLVVPWLAAEGAGA